MDEEEKAKEEGDVEEEENVEGEDVEEEDVEEQEEEEEQEEHPELLSCLPCGLVGLTLTWVGSSSAKHTVAG